MNAVNVLCLIAGIVLAGLGGYAVFFLSASKPLNNTEIEMMKEDGKWEDEPDYMQTFRIARAEFDLEGNERWTRRSWIAVVIGIVLIVSVFVF